MYVVYNVHIERMGVVWECWSLTCLDCSRIDCAFLDAWRFLLN